MEQTAGKIRYVDFWATWCHPCIADFKVTKDFKRRLSSEANVDFIYISVENADHWKENSNLLKEFLVSEHQYRFLEVEDSRMLPFLKVRRASGIISLPKYTVIDEKGEIISANAPRLADSVGVKKLLKNSNGKRINPGLKF